MIFMFQGTHHEFIDVTGRCTLQMTQTSLHSVTERKIVFKRIIRTKAVQFEGRKRPFSSHACSSLGVVVRLQTETLNFLFQNNELINLISLKEESVTFLTF